MLYLPVGNGGQMAANGLPFANLQRGHDACAPAFCKRSDQDASYVAGSEATEAANGVLAAVSLFVPDQTTRGADLT